MNEVRRIAVENRPFSRHIALWFTKAKFTGAGHATLVASPLAYGDYDDSTLEPPEPTVNLSHEECQKLIDDLWACGFRPTEGSGSAGSLAATERHLADMRTLLFASLEVPLTAK